MSDDDVLNTISDKVMSLEIHNPTYNMFYPMGQEDPVDSEYIKRNDHYDTLTLSLETLDVRITKQGESIKDIAINESSGYLHQKIQSQLPPAIKKLKENFKKEIKENSKKISTKDNIKTIKEKWCIEIAECLAQMYGFDIQKPINCFSVQMRTKLRELIRIDKILISQVMVHIINKFADRLKASIHSRINSAHAKENTTIAEKIHSLEDLNRVFGKLLPQGHTYYDQFNIDLYEMDSSTSISKAIYALNDVYEEMNRVLKESKQLFALLTLHLKLSSIPITIEEIHWRIFYETVYTESNLKTLLCLHSADISKKDIKCSSMLQNMSNFLHKIKIGWNDKVCQLNCLQRKKLIDTMLFNEEYIKVSKEDAIYNCINTPIMELKEECVIDFCEDNKAEPKKKKRRRKKKAKQTINEEPQMKNQEEIKEIIVEEEPDKENNEGVDLDILVENAPKAKPLKVPNIRPEKLSALKEKFLAKLKSPIYKM